MRKKIRFYKALLVEIIETLCSILIYIDEDARLNHRIFGYSTRSHFVALKRFSEKMREDLIKGGRNERK